MSLNFENIQVSINGTGSFSSSARLSTKAQLTPVYSIGSFDNIKQTPAGPLRNTLSLTYTMDVSREAALELIHSYKRDNGVDISPVSVILGGISGQFYLESANLSVNPNDLVDVTVNFVGFNEISGSQESSELALDNNEQLAHGWVTLINTQGNYKSSPLLDFNYEFRCSLQPIYTINNKTPVQVNILDGSENFSVTRDLYTGIGFSGDNSSFFLLNENGEEVKFLGLAQICSENTIDNLDNATGNYVYINLSGSIINSVESRITNNDILRTTFSASKFF